MKFIICTVILVAVLILSVGWLTRPLSESERVYRACMSAREDNTIFNDNYCKALQDDFGLRFVCKGSECEVIKL